MLLFLPFHTPCLSIAPFSLILKDSFACSLHSTSTLCACPFPITITRLLSRPSLTLSLFIAIRSLRPLLPRQPPLISRVNSVYGPIHHLYSLLDNKSLRTYCPFSLSNKQRLRTCSFSRLPGSVQGPTLYTPPFTPQLQLPPVMRHT